MATLAPQGRITVDLVEAEITALQARWAAPVASDPAAQLAAFMPADRISRIDLFDRAQLAQVLSVCADSSSLSDAGRKLFQASRQKRASTNDSDRLRKYLARFELQWSDVSGR